MTITRSRIVLVAALLVVPFTGARVASAIPNHNTSGMKIAVDGVVGDIQGHGDSPPGLFASSADQMLFGQVNTASDAVVSNGAAVGARRYMSTKANRGFYFGLPQGPIQKITCSDATVKPYRLATVTLSNLTIDTSAQTVWVFHDASIGQQGTTAGGQRWVVPPTDAAAKAARTTAPLDMACDGTTKIVDPLTPDVTMAETSAYLHNTDTDFLSKGYKLTLPSGLKTLSMKVLVPVFNDGTTAKNITALGFLVASKRIDTLATMSDISLSSGYGIETYIYSEPFSENAGYSILSDCTGSESATAAPCVVSANTGFVGKDYDGTSNISGYQVQMKTISTTQGTDVSSALFVDMKRTTPASGINGQKGYRIPDDVVAKIQLSLPSSGTSVGIDFAANDYSKSWGQTKLLMDPKGNATDNVWQIGTSGSRRLITVSGRVKTMSSAVSTTSWYETCRVSFETTFTATDCGSQEELSSNSVAVVDASYARFMVQFASRFGDDMAGAYISTNGQAMQFGPKTISGEAFQFGVAGPSVRENGSSRATDGFWYVCMPEKFIANKWKSTLDAVVPQAKATRDGVALGATYDTEKMSVEVSNCGSSKGMLAYVPNFHYSSPVFTVERSTTAAANTSAISGTTSSVAVAPKVRVSKLTTAKTIATYLKWKVLSTSKLTLKVLSSSAKYCKVSGTSVKGIKAGACKATITMKTKAGKSTSKTVTLTVIK